MNVDVSERAFEDAIEACLLQHSGGAVTEERASYLDMPPGGYQKRQNEDYDRALCLIPRTCWTSFWRRSQRSGSGFRSITGGR